MRSNGRDWCRLPPVENHRPSLLLGFHMLRCCLPMGRGPLLVFGRAPRPCRPCRPVQADEIGDNSRFIGGCNRGVDDHISAGQSLPLSSMDRVRVICSDLARTSPHCRR